MTVYCLECWVCKHGIIRDGEFVGCDNECCKFEKKTKHHITKLPKEWYDPAEDDLYKKTELLEKNEPQEWSSPSDNSSTAKLSENSITVKKDYEKPRAEN